MILKQEHLYELQQAKSILYISEVYENTEMHIYAKRERRYRDLL